MKKQFLFLVVILGGIFFAQYSEAQQYPSRQGTQQIRGESSRKEASFESEAGFVVATEASLPPEEVIAADTGEEEYSYCRWVLVDNRYRCLLVTIY